LVVCVKAAVESSINAIVKSVNCFLITCSFNSL
jgi:hypothetical protein